MIVRPNCDSMPANKNSPDATSGHAMGADTNFRRPTPMTASNTNRGAGNGGFGFSTDPTGEVDYPRPDQNLEGLPGITGGGLGTPWKGV